VSHLTHTVDDLSRLVYAIAPTGTHPAYEARTSPDETQALLLALRSDDDRPDVDWHDAAWAREQTQGWDEEAL